MLAQHARAGLVEKEFEVVEPSIVKRATIDRMPKSLQMAPQIVQEANLAATALYSEVRRWEPMPSEKGMKAGGVIVAAELTIVDPTTGTVLWQSHRSARPFPLYRVLLSGPANLLVAVMREMVATVKLSQPDG